MQRLFLSCSEKSIQKSPPAGIYAFSVISVCISCTADTTESVRHRWAGPIKTKKTKKDLVQTNQNMSKIQLRE